MIILFADNGFELLRLGVLPHEIYQHYYVTLRITCISQVLLVTVLQPLPRVAAPSSLRPPGYKCPQLSRIGWYILK